VPKRKKRVLAAYGIIDPDYARIFSQARIIAWQYGYACVMHGSFSRDLDLLLTPWEHRARPNHDQLVKLIALTCDLRFRDGELNILKAKPDFTDRPHGRRSVTLFFLNPRDRRWIDISIAPCVLNGSVEGHTEYASWFKDGSINAENLQTTQSV
jgi:hypothetical protein